MTKRAAVYVRVSSEVQAERVSPQAQEADCREYCQRHGYLVAGVYRDTEKYRVGRRLVEPSGTRADRPQLKQMIAHADTGEFDVIIAWREDRLYRSYRPMLNVLECIERNHIEIELVKETFDPKIAPVKAWAAKTELDAKRDRFMMGMAGRLAAGKVRGPTVPYGFCREGDQLLIEPTEAQWVNQIWQWYGEWIGVREIRRRLISAGAPQKKAKQAKVVKWSNTIIYRLLHRDFYYTGIQRVKWDRREFELHVPVIVPADIASKVVHRLQRAIIFKARNVKSSYLAMGVAYCQSCKVKMGSQTLRFRAGGVLRKTPIQNYVCHHKQFGYKRPNCAGKVTVKKIDKLVWEKVWAVIADDALFGRLIQCKMEAVQKDEAEATADVERLQRELDSMSIERQWVITQARKKAITEDDMEMQLAGLAIHEAGLRRELDETSLLVGNRAQRLLEFVNKYRAEIRNGADWLNTTPTTEEEGERQFKLRREIIESLVKRVEVLPDKTVLVHFEFDFSGEQQSQSAVSIGLPLSL